MRLTLRSVLALAVCFIVLLFLSYLIFSWQVHYTFRADLAVGGVWVGVVLIGLFSKRDRGLPATMRRDMWDEHYGRQPSPVRPGAASDSRKAHRSFASAIGGHVAHALGHLRALVAVGGGYRRQVVYVTTNS